MTATSSNTVTTTNLIQGPADIYTADFGADEPADSQVNASPAATAWTGVGATLGGAEWTVAQTWAELEVDQIVDRVESRLTKRGLGIKTQLAEPTLDNLKLALNGGTAASGVGFKSYDPDEMTSATQPTYRAIILDGYGPGSLRRRVIIRKVLSTDDVGIKYSKTDQGVWTVTFTAHYVDASTPPFHVVDATA